MRTDDRYARLAAHPALAACSRREVRVIARNGDEVDVAAGTVLLHEDGIGYWWIAVIRGTVDLVRRGRTIGRIGAGEHVGHVAILGFGPQPATAIASSPARLFVLGRRNLLDLVHRAPGLRRGLAPGVGPERFDAYLRELRAAGAAAWADVPRRRTAPHDDGGDASTNRPPELRFVRRAERSNAFVALARAAVGRRAATAGVITATSTQHLSRGVRAAVAGAATAAIVWFALAFHPPFFVVRASPPVDVAADITVTVGGVPQPPPVNGTYLLTAVDVDQPTIAGLLWALASGEEAVAADGAREPGVSDATARRIGVEAFRASRAHAVDAATAAAGIERGRVHVHFRERDLTGPSAGLVYALALADALDSDDLARGRTIAATGAVGPDGKVGAVGFLTAKGASARRGEADLFLVPAAQTANSRPPAGAVAVATLEDAVRVLRERAAPAGR